MRPTALAARANSAYPGRKRNFFVLADDPDEGKTVVVGLLLRELKMRGTIERQASCILTRWKDVWGRVFLVMEVICHER